jgi:hypothetical protein
VDTWTLTRRRDVDELKIEVAEALILKPGDRVLLLLRDGYHWTREFVDQANRVLGERFPDVTFGFVDGVERAVIERDEDHPRRAD